MVATRRPGNPPGPAHPDRLPGVLPAPARPAHPAGNLVSTARPGRNADRGLPACAGHARRRPGNPGQAPRAAPAPHLPERRRARRVCCRDGSPPGIGGIRRPGLLVRLAPLHPRPPLADRPVGRELLGRGAAEGGPGVQQRRPAPHRDDIGASPPRLRRKRDPGTRPVQGPGRARPAPGRAQAAAHARPGLRPQRRGRLAGAETLLGDEPAGGQPAAAAAALLRRRHLRRGLPDHPRRRGHLHPARQATRGRRGQQAAPADRVLRLRQHRRRLRPARAGQHPRL